ncbi:hypothetical protein [Mycolicibacterium boenickei]|nr:hypothetical protein [Mycolicibacterium boenickei]
MARSGKHSCDVPYCGTALVVAMVTPGLVGRVVYLLFRRRRE